MCTVLFVVFSVLNVYYEVSTLFFSVIGLRGKFKYLNDFCILENIAHP